MANMYAYNTSTARKLSDADFSYGHNLRSEIQKEVNKTAKKAMPKASQKRGKKGFVSVVLAFAMAFSVVSGYVSINEANNEISRLKNEYNSIVADNQALQVKIDRTIDLGQLQSIAGEKYGMVSPERYQMFYVDLEMGDFSESTDVKIKNEQTKKMAISGVPGIITGALNIFQ